MKKIRLKMVIVLEYPLEEDAYPEGITEEEMLSMDIKMFQNDPSLIFELKGNRKIEVDGMIINVCESTQK